jgi:cytochrome c2
VSHKTTIGLTLAALIAFAATPASAMGDAVNGKALFMRCAICHKVTKDGGNGLGPNLFGVGGRKAGTVPGFSYSVAMKTSDINWTEEKLEAYIADPKGVVPGNRMAFAGLSNRTLADDVAAYLITLK